MIGRAEIRRTIRNTIADTGPSDRDALRQLGVDPHALEAEAMHLAQLLDRGGVTGTQAIGAAFAAGFEIGLRLGRDPESSAA